VARGAARFSGDNHGDRPPPKKTCTEGVIFNVHTHRLCGWRPDPKLPPTPPLVGTHHRQACLVRCTKGYRDITSPYDKQKMDASRNRLPPLFRVAIRRIFKLPSFRILCTLRGARRRRINGGPARGAPACENPMVSAIRPVAMPCLCGEYCPVPVRYKTSTSTRCDIYTVLFTDVVYLQ
jgi:hypothetical protein